MKSINKVYWNKIELLEMNEVKIIKKFDNVVYLSWIEFLILIHVDGYDFEEYD